MNVATSPFVVSRYSNTSFKRRAYFVEIATASPKVRLQPSM